MGGRTREALFDLLRGWCEDATVIDLFAGVGTLGLEAVSRGAIRVACVERDRFIARLLRENVRTLRCEERVTVVEADALSEGTLAALPRPADLIFCDPPFALAMDAGAAGPSAARDAARFAAMLPRLRALMGGRGFLALRLPEPRRGSEGRIAGFDGPEIHGYGDQQWIHLYAPSAARGVVA